MAWTPTQAACCPEEGGDAQARNPHAQQCNMRVLFGPIAFIVEKSNTFAHPFVMLKHSWRLKLNAGPDGTGSQDSGGSDLLETPALCSMPSQQRRAPGPSRLRIATQQSADGAPADADEVCPTHRMASMRKSLSFTF